MQSGILVSLLLHAAAIVPLLFMLTPRIEAPGHPPTIATQFVAQTVNIESLRPDAPPLVQPEIAPLPEAPVISEAEQAVAVTPIRPEEVEPKPSEPPPERVALQEPETVPETAPEIEPPPEPMREPPPERQVAKEPEPLPEPEPPAEPVPPVPDEPAVEPQPPAPKRLAMVNEPPAPAAASAAQEAQEAAGAGAEAPDPDYLARINALLESNKQYPYMAQRLGIEGELDLWFELNSQGEVLDYRIDDASGQAMLYEEVERLIQETAFPPFPPDFDEDKLSVKVRISFHLMG